MNTFRVILTHSLENRNSMGRKLKSDYESYKSDINLLPATPAL